MSSEDDPQDRQASDADYEVVDADLHRACDDAVRVWGTTIGWPERQRVMYERYYLEYPGPAPMLKLLRHIPTGEVVGTVGIGTRRVLWNGKEIRAGVASHLCVDERHRKHVPAALLAKATLAACMGRFNVLYGMPSTPVAQAFARQLGFPGVGEQVRRVKVLRYAKYLARRLPSVLASVAGAAVDGAKQLRGMSRRDDSLTAHWVDQSDARMASLWASAPMPNGWNAVRDEAMLRWRFDRLPSARRRYLLLAEGTSDVLRAWFACDTNFFDPDILVVNDFWCASGPAAIEPAMIRSLCREARAAGFSALESRLVAPDDVAAPWVREGFVERNRFPIFMLWVDRELAVTAPGALHITDFDNDG